MPKKIVVLGSTGSIGKQTLEVVRQYPELFEVIGLGAGGSRLQELLEQAVEFRAPYIGVGISSAAPREIVDTLAAIKRRRGAGGYEPELSLGGGSSAELAACDDALVVNAITGSIGLEPTLAALNRGNKVALANKESLVAGGELVVDAARRQGGGVLQGIYPVDSEHSAIAQCLMGGASSEVDRLIITASGGPFRGYTARQLKSVSVAEAMNHPTWNMGTVITINSATMVNKGLEVIEASLLFDIPVNRIDTVVHPQSIVHSMVRYYDGSIIAQASPPTMKLPIALALNTPDRLEGAIEPLSFKNAMEWSFEPMDEEVFPAVRMAREAITAGKTYPAVYNAANEEAVSAFAAGRVQLPDINSIIERTVAEHRPSAAMTLEGVLDAESWARSYAAGVMPVYED